MEQIALDDKDGTLVDYDNAIYRDLMAMKGPGEVLRESDLHDLPPHLEARRRAIVNTPGWWYSLEKLHVGFMILEMLRDIGFKVHILTKGPSWCPLAWKEKVEWNHIKIPETRTGEIGVRIVTDGLEGGGKNLDYGKVLVDDYPPYVEAWLEYRPRGLVVMPEKDYNRFFQHPQVVHFNGTNPKYLRQLLELVYQRKSGESLELPVH